MRNKIFLILFLSFLVCFIYGEDYKSFITKLNLNLEEIQVTTEDRYINTIWALTSKDEFNRNGKSIILQHGLLDGGWTWLILQEKSLAKLLCDEGYKVYLPYIRGTQFSKSHLIYDTDLNSEYWDFSFDEIVFPSLISFLIIL